MRMSRGTRIQWAAGFIGLTLAITISCSQMPVETAAPVLSPEPGSKVSQEDLAAGRAIYVSKEKCAHCHNPKPVNSYTAKDWKKAILPVMADKAKLKPEEYELLAAYVTAGSRAKASQ